MNRQEYHSLLRRLPIVSPTPQDMAMLCPHLTADEAVEAFTTDSGIVACPSIRIRDCYHTLSYFEERVEENEVRGDVADGKINQTFSGTKNQPARIVRTNTFRTRESYVGCRSRGDVFLSVRYMDRAMMYAKDHWGDELILDSWDSVVEFYVQDPTDLVSDRYRKDYPRTKAVLRVTLTRDFNEVNNDHSEPKSILFDKAISQMAVDHIIWDELKGGRGGFTMFNCANCGAGLGLSGCSGCGHRFRDDHSRSGSNMPLSRNMVAFLRENGHAFKVDPEIALEKEREYWKSIFA